MIDETTTVFRGDKNAETILALCELYEITLEKATDIFYNSDTSILIEEGIADLHCRSPKYLAQCIWDEYLESQ